MAIRIRNLDLQADGGKGNHSVSLGDVTATLERAVFVAPVACRVDFIDLYSGQGVSSVSDSTIMAIRPQLAGASDSLLAAKRSTSGSSLTSDAISANVRYRFVCSANNSLTQGTVVELNFSAVASAVLSAVIVNVVYTPLTHRESR